MSNYDTPGMPVESEVQQIFKLLRDTTPVFSITEGPRRGTMVLTNKDVLEVLRNPEIFSSGSDAVEIGQIRPLIPLQIDPPKHAMYRKLLDPLFAPKRVAVLEPRTRALVTELIDKVIDKGECNFHSDIAEPLPSTVFLELLGLPASRVHEFIALKDGIIRPPTEDVEERVRMVNETGQKIYAVLEEVTAERIKERKNDFISGFIDAEVDGKRLTKEEVIDICYLFFLGGLDTVTASLDCMIAYLARHSDQRQQLIDDPDLIPRAIEELLRWESPVSGVARIAREDTELSGCPIRAGEQLHVILGSANTDETAWANPNLVDFNREGNKHLAFGGGVHRCLGSHLARLELRVVLEEWHKRVPNYQIKPGTEIIYSAGLRQIDDLQLIW